MAEQELMWPQAVELLCEQLQWYALWRDQGLHIVAAAYQAGIGDHTADVFEQTLTEIRTPKTDATPSQARPEVAETAQDQ